MDLILLLPVLLFSVVVHEVAHGWTALKQGDPTARDLGRLTLNPVAHLDPFGSVIFPIVLWATNAPFLFGWAKPVPVNPANFREYRRGDIIVSLAGIVSNLILALGFTLLTVVLVHVGRAVPPVVPATEVLERMAGYGLLINLVLAFFNLIPIPPLDGSHVLAHLLPRTLRNQYRELGRYGMIVLLAILFFAPGVVSFFLMPVYVLQDLARRLVIALI
ncbi:MAG TPA: site-2 protease family protein [Longimicrobiales bacterium]|nr:site-2 protease family protein [Longimicrobiales bacterium]